MDDLVSRQDAIDALMNNADWADAIPTIKSLPSSEPNIKCIAQIRIDRDDMENLVNEIVDKMSEPKKGKWIEQKVTMLKKYIYAQIVKTMRRGEKWKRLHIALTAEQKWRYRNE